MPMAKFEQDTHAAPPRPPRYWMGPLCGQVVDPADVALNRHVIRKPAGCVGHYHEYWIVCQEIHDGYGSTRYVDRYDYKGIIKI